MEKIFEKIDIFVENLEDKKDEYAVLSYVVDELDCIPDEVVSYIAKKLDVFEFSINGTIDFYPKLKKAKTKYYVQVCVGRNCVQSGLKEKLEEIRGKVDYIIEERHCLGQCGKSSNIFIGDKNYKYKTLDELENILLNLK